MKRVLTLVAAALLSVTALPWNVGTAGAVPGAPTLQLPADGASVDRNPVVEWAPVAGALRYRVQIDDDPNFGSPAFNNLTLNTRYGHPSDLALGSWHWRVAAIDGGGQGEFSEVWSFEKVAAEGPTLASPADAAVLEFPADDAVFSWEPFAGADRYEVEIDDETDFQAPQVLKTDNTSYSLTSPPTLDKVFYWRVRAFSSGNQPSQYSEIRDYTVTWPSVPQLVSPADDNSPTNAIEEVVFEWEPTPGAVTYDVQISPDDQFASGVFGYNTIHSTRFSPPTTLDNGAYYWRVRAKHAGGAVGDWSEIRTFYRAWPAPDAAPNHRVTLLAPADGDVEVPVPVFHWTPVRLASQYRIELSTDENFSNSVIGCDTNHTTFVPLKDHCFPRPGVDYYWRVRPLDAPGGIIGLWSATSRFQYEPGIPALIAPADGAAIEGPATLTWQAVPNAQAYKVVIVQANGSTLTYETVTTAFVPQNLDLAQGPFRWYVRAVTASGDGVIPNESAWRTFSVTASSSTFDAPDPVTADGTGGTHIPNLTWLPVTGADNYQIWTALSPSSTYSLLPTGAIKVNSYTHPASALGPGTYTWYVVARSGTTVLATGAQGSFVVHPLAPTTLLGPAHCEALANCPVENETPTFEWQWAQDATHYRVYLARDPNFTNLITNGQVVHLPYYRPTSSLPDAQAGQATYWYARPCYGTSPERCGPEAGTFAGSNPPVFAFRKRSEPVELGLPLHQGPQDAALAAHENQITFTWNDYLATNLDAPQPNDVEAHNYRIEIGTTPDLANPIHSKVVDQTTYTPYEVTLPDGPLYWRVAAYDGSGNLLPFSDTHLVHKRSPIPAALSPAIGAEVDRVPLFSWGLVPYTNRYAIEVYRNVDQPLSTTNRVLNTTTSMTSWSPTTPLPAGVYGWRVQRHDADNRPGPWSAATNDKLRLFTVTGDQVTLLSPADGHAYLSSHSKSFTWSPAETAAQYRFQVSDSPLFTTTKESVTTVMTSWHPTIAYTWGTWYWRVLTLDGAGNVTATSQTRSFTHGPPAPGPVYLHPMAPVRILDSRPGPLNVGAYSTPWNSGQIRDVQVAAISGVPADAVAVVLNATVTGTSADSFLKVWPKGQSEPSVSNLNWAAGSTVANAVTVTVGTDQAVQVKNHFGRADVVLDTVGYYLDDADTGSGFTPMAPTRIIDSRPGSINVGPYSSPWGSAATREVTVTAAPGVPADAAAVVLNVTATGGTAGSFLTVYPKGGSLPNASSVNFAPGQTVPNAVTARVGTDGKIMVRNNFGTVDVVIDVVGYFHDDSGAPYRPLPNPIRIQDSRPSGPQVGPYGSKWGAGTDRTVQVAGEVPAGVPASATAALLNVTVANTTAGSFLTVYPDGTTRPSASSLNWVGGQVIPNSVTTQLGTNGRIRAWNYFGQTDVIMDISGYYGP